MDRSVDSIGSCSLDVDADSTDFSGEQCGTMGDGLNEAKNGT